MISVHTIKRICILSLLASLQTGCSKSETPKYNAAQASSEMQKSGVMSQETYLRIDDLGHKTHKSHTISNDDLNWTVSTLNTGGNAIVRARAMTVLSEIRPMSSAQKAVIAQAIAPYLNSSNRLDYLSAKRVELTIQQSP